MLVWTTHQWYNTSKLQHINFMGSSSKHPVPNKAVHESESSQVTHMGVTSGLDPPCDTHNADTSGVLSGVQELVVQIDAELRVGMGLQ
jgi:hypothetical protein